MSDWPSILLALNSAGLTTAAICEATGAGKTTIVDLAAGTTADPRHSLGCALLRLHAQHCHGNAHVHRTPATGQGAAAEANGVEAQPLKKAA